MNKEEENLWKVFKGRKNTEEVLKEKAEILANLACDIAIEGTKAFYGALEEYARKNELKIDMDKSDTIFFETILFYLHVSDRIAYQYLEPDQRKYFIDTIFQLMRSHLSMVSHSSVKIDEFAQSFTAAYNIRQLEYGKYKKAFAGKNEGMKDTLFWEFTKKISLVAGFAEDMVVIMYAHECIEKPVLLFQLPELFKEQ